MEIWPRESYQTPEDSVEMCYDFGIVAKLETAGNVIPFRALVKPTTDGILKTEEIGVFFSSHAVL